VTYYLNNSRCVRSPCGRLVFLRNLKCASTYYSFLLQKNGWVEQSPSTIDWDNDYVFSFIMDPYVRHIKGLVEDLTWQGIEKPLIDLMSRQFWLNLPWIGDHSMPMTIRLGDKADKIDWIPIDVDGVSSQDELNKLLAKFDISITWYEGIFRRESDPYKKDLYKKISYMSPYKDLLLRELTGDYRLYESVVAKYKNDNTN